MSGDSSDDEDVVVLRVCANRHCQSIDNLEFDVETNQSYCGRCRDLYARTETEGFRILLSDDDLALVRLIFDHFDTQRRGYWTFKDWNRFQETTDRGAEEPMASADDLRDFFVEEYDLRLAELGIDGTVVRIIDLENMYGGYLFNNVDALVEDSETLEDAGVLNTGVLE